MLPLSLYDQLNWFMNNKQKLFLMVGISSFVVFLITMIGLGFLPYTIYYSKNYKSDPLMYLFDTKKREMVVREVKHQYESYKPNKDYRVENYYKFLDDGEKIEFDRYVDDTIEYKKWKQYPNKKSYYFNPKQIFKLIPLTDPTSYSINWIGIIAVFSITVSTLGFVLFKD